MTELLVIEGAGGKGGGSARPPVEANDTLRSKQQIRLLFAIGEGEIDAVEDVLLNKVSIANFDAAWDWRPGTQNQTVVPGFINTESLLPAFSPAQITNGNDYVYSIDYDANAARLTFGLDSLRKINPDNGDVNGYSVTLQVYARPNPLATWTLAKVVTKTGKASSPYAWDVQIEQPDGVTSADPWQLKIVRTTDDDVDLKTSSVTRISAITRLYYSNLAYPGTALVAVTINDADQFGGQVPKIAFKVRGKKVKIPNNYDPVARTYTGTWDLGMTDLMLYYTDNPAWHLYHVLTDTVSGLAIPESDIDRISFYELSQYCDGMVDDGRGGQQYRYTLHNQYYTREAVPRFLSYLLSICNAQFSTNEFGQITVAFDRPGLQASKLVTNANVVDGRFNYSSNDLETRFSLVNVTYNNALSYGETDTATESDDALIDRYGLQSSDIVLPGCSTEAQAKRKARWAIWTNGYDTEIVSFQVLFAGVHYFVGDIVKIMDSHNAGAVQHGVVTNYAYAIGVGTLTLDRVIEFGAGPYTLSYLDADGETIHDVAIDQDSTSTDTVTFTGADNAPFICGAFVLSGQIEPRLCRVVSVKKEDDIYTVAALPYNEAKFSYIETGIVVDQPSGDFVNVDAFTVEPVVNLAVVESSASDGVNHLVKLNVYWDWDTDHSSKYRASYIATWRRDNQEFKTLRDIAGRNFDIDNAVPGVYEITVWAASPVSGIKSVPVSIVHQYRTGAGNSALLPPANVRVTGTSGLVFSTPALSLSFDYEPANDDVSDALLDYVVEVWDSSVLSKKATYAVKPNENRNGLFYLPFAENAALFSTPTRAFVVKIYSRDVGGYLSTAAQVSVSNPAPLIVSFSAAAAFQSAALKATLPTDPDVESFVFRKYVAATGGTALETIASTSNVVNVDAQTGVEYFYSAAAVDSYGEGVETSRVAATAVSVDPDVYTYVGLQFTPNSPAVNSVSWSAFQAYKNGVLSASVTAGNAAWSSGTLYLYFVPGNEALQSTTSLSAAIAAGGRILATYEGGTDLTHDEGRAFISGDQLLAGTVGASALVTNTAVITNAAQIGNVLQSSNYSWVPGDYSGWRIDKDGWVQASALTLRNSNGDVILSAGTGVEYQYINNKPTSLNGINGSEGSKLSGIEAGATVGADWSTNIVNAPEFYETFENSSVGNWDSVSGPGELSVESVADSVAGGKVLRIGNNAGNDQAYLIHKNNIAYNPNALYRIRFRVRRTSGTGTVYLGVNGIAADGVTKVNVLGSNTNSNQHYVAAVSSPPSSTWTQYTGYFTGTGATGTTGTNPDISDPRTLHQDVRYIRPMILVNYNGQTGVTEVDFCSIDILSDKIDWGGVSGPGRPADGATVNHVYTQTTTPTSGMVTGDIWIDTDDSNKMYVYSGSAWVQYRDAGIAQALTDAATAQATADGKIDSFFQASAPTSGVSVGDLWFDIDAGNKMYRYSGSAWVVAQDNAVNTAIANAATAQATADGKVETFFATSTPTASGVGDLWYNTSNSLFKRWSGSSWDVVSNSYANTLQLTDGAGLGTTAAWSGVSGRPTNLAGINSTEGMKLAGIADGADVTASSPQSPSWLSSPVVWSGNKISSVNIATYMASAAISDAYIANLSASKINAGYLAAARIQAGVVYVNDGNIGNLAVGQAQLKNAAVDTLQLAGDAVTIPRSASGITSASITITTADFPAGTKVHVICSAWLHVAINTGSYAEKICYLKIDGVTVRDGKIAADFLGNQLDGMASMQYNFVFSGSPTTISLTDCSDNAEIMLIGLKR